MEIEGLDTETARVCAKDAQSVLAIDLVVGLVEAVDDEFLGRPYEWKLSRYMPTVGEVVVFQCFLHHSWHIGQLAEWRRLMGYDSALRKLVSEE